MPAGLPIRVDDPEWQDWLAEAPVTAGTTLLEAMQSSRRLRRWLDAVPPIDSLSPEERWEIGNDLLHLCEQLAEEVRARSSAGGIGVALTFAGALGAFLLPPAAPAIAVVTLVVTGGVWAMAHNQNRRQEEMEAIIRLTRALGWSLRR